MELINPRILPDPTRSYPIRRAQGALDSAPAQAPVAAECLMDVDINGIHTLRLVCSPSHPAELILGHLVSEGLVKGPEEVDSIIVYEGMERARVFLADKQADLSRRMVSQVPTCCTGNRRLNSYFEGDRALKPVTPIAWEDRWIFDLARTFASDSPHHKATFGTHSCYLAQGSKVLYCCEDLGRHNAMDKVLGCALRDGVDLTRCILFSSGRMPEDMVAKAIRAKVPILATKAVPTEGGIAMARACDLTLICSAHPDAMDVFNEPKAKAASQPLPRGVVRSVNVSARKGTRKAPVPQGFVTLKEGWGVAEDAHAGDWHRQVSMLAWESVQKAQSWGLDVAEGDFAENITSEGIDLLKLPLGTRVRVGEALLELSQIGKACHTRCAIYFLAGDCIFPREGIFYVVLEGGTVRVGDPIEVVSLGDGTCPFTPPEALQELEEWKAKHQEASRERRSAFLELQDAPLESQGACPEQQEASRD